MLWNTPRSSGISMSCCCLFGSRSQDTTCITSALLFVFLEYIWRRCTQKCYDIWPLSPEIEQELFSLFNCTEIPCPSNIKMLIRKLADFTFLKKPLPAILELNTGIPPCHRPFWSNMTLDQLHSIYTAIAVAQGKVLSLINEPSFQTKAQETTWCYLRKFNGNCSGDDLRNFLRFTTGCFVITVLSISVLFNNLHGLACRPISHTCSSILELSSSYATYMDFSQEFNAVINSMACNIDSMTMDSV